MGALSNLNKKKGSGKAKKGIKSGGGAGDDE
jgi:hypothetical protein